MIWLFIAGGFALTAVTAVPLGIGIAVTGLAILHWLANGATSLAITAGWNVLTDFLLSAIPLFIYMGEILLRSGLSSRVYNAIAPLFVRVPGRLLHTNIAVSAMFGAISGASTSTAAAVGGVAYPELSKRGYDRRVVVATLAAGGTLGILIPPSLSLLIYGATQGVSIGRLFLAGVVPGLMMALLFMVVIFIHAKFENITPATEPPPPSHGRILLNLLQLWPIVVIAFATLGTIYLGIATPTEAAALAVVSAIVIGFLVGDLTLAKLVDSFVSGTIVFASLGIVIVGALILSQAISILAVPTKLVALVTGLGLSKWALLLLVVLFYVVMGCFFDGLSLMVMTLPFVFPLMTAYFDPVWFGVILTVLIEIGLLTPPVGLNLFVLVAIARGEVSLEAAARAVTPYWIMMLLAILIMTVFPAVALWLPNALFQPGGLGR